jgi:small conductance mechanosensitive channel
MKDAIDFRKFYDHAYDWILRYGPRFILGIVVLFIGLWLIRFLLGLSHRKMQRKEVDPTIKPFLMSVLGIALRLLLVLSVMQIIGIQMTFLAIIVGAFIVGVGLALSSTLQSFARAISVRPLTTGWLLCAEK